MSGKDGREGINYNNYNVEEDPDAEVLYFPDPDVSTTHPRPPRENVIPAEFRNAQEIFNFDNPGRNEVVEINGVRYIDAQDLAIISRLWRNNSNYVSSTSQQPEEEEGQSTSSTSQEPQAEEEEELSEQSREGTKRSAEDDDGPLKKKRKRDDANS